MIMSIENALTHCQFCGFTMNFVCASVGVSFYRQDFCGKIFSYGQGLAIKLKLKKSWTTVECRSANPCKQLVQKC